jgi:hypothetical protein
LGWGIGKRVFINSFWLLIPNSKLKTPNSKLKTQNS